MSLLLTFALLAPAPPTLAAGLPAEGSLQRPGAPVAAAPALAQEGLFRAASDDLVVVAGEGGAAWKLLDVVQEYERLTGQNIHLSEETRGTLEKAPTGLSGSVVVPKDEVQRFFERLLVENGFVLTYQPEGETRLLGVAWKNGYERDFLRGKAFSVPPEDLSAWGDHSAVLITTTVHLPSTDARALASALRSTIVDGRTQLMAPASSSSVVLVGFADKVVSQVEMLRAIDRANAKEAAKIEPSVRRFALEFAVASEVARSIEDLAGAAHPLSPSAEGDAGPIRPRVVADHRTNALVVLCLPADMPRVAELVSLFDAEQD